MLIAQGSTGTTAFCIETSSRCQRPLATAARPEGCYQTSTLARVRCVVWPIRADTTPRQGGSAIVDLAALDHDATVDEYVRQRFRLSLTGRDPP